MNAWVGVAMENLTLEARLKLRDKLHEKLAAYHEVLEHLARERMLLWEQEVLNDKEIRRLQMQGKENVNG